MIYQVWKVSLNLALRISDALKITKDEAKEFLKTGSYLSRDKKTGKQNKQKLNKTTIEAFEIALELSKEGNDFLFTGTGNRSASTMKSISRQQVDRVYKEVANYEGIKIDIGTHTARKSFGAILYRQGVSIEKIMIKLNHSSTQQTLKYIGITQEDLDDLSLEFEL